jgi:hypothetical protein
MSAAGTTRLRRAVGIARNQPHLLLAQPGPVHPASRQTLDASRYGSGERADPVLGDPRRPGASKSVDTEARAVMGC